MCSLTDALHHTNNSSYGTPCLLKNTNKRMIRITRCKTWRQPFIYCPASLLCIAFEQKWHLFGLITRHGNVDSFLSDAEKYLQIINSEIYCCNSFTLGIIFCPHCFISFPKCHKTALLLNGPPPWSLFPHSV